MDQGEIVVIDKWAIIRKTVKSKGIHENSIITVNLNKSQE